MLKVGICEDFAGSTLLLTSRAREALETSRTRHQMRSAAPTATRPCARPSRRFVSAQFDV